MALNRIRLDEQVNRRESRPECQSPEDLLFVMCEILSTMLIPMPTARLEFRIWREEDIRLAEVLWCDPEVMSHMGGKVSPEEARSRLRTQMAMHREHGVQYWPLALRCTGEFMGCSGLRPWGQAGPNSKILELGCHVMRNGWGKRLGEEACRSVLSHAFDKLNLPIIVAGHKVSNDHSSSMMSRLGMRYTHESWYAPGGFDVKWYELTRGEWK